MQQDSADRGANTAAPGRRLAWNRLSRAWRQIAASLADRMRPWRRSARRQTIEALKAAGKLDEADLLLAAAMAEAPDSFEIAFDYATLAEGRGDRNETLRRWQEVGLRFPGEPTAYVEIGSALRKLGRLEEADAVLEAAMARIPDRVVLASEYAANADLRGDHAEALRRWAAVRARFPDKAIGYAGLGAALKTVRRLDESEAVFADGLVRFPDDQNLAVNYAWHAVARENWPEALRRWEALRASYPSEPSIAAGLEQTTYHMHLAAADALAAADGDSGSGETGAARFPDALAAGDLDPAPARFRDLLMRFESLGENCELGFVQRHFGAEPLGLLRWAGIPYRQLMDGLAIGFAGVGEPENTVLRLDPVNREYATADTRFDMRMHTFIFENKEQEAAIFGKLCRRLRYLRDKFLDDLRAGEKIWVFQFGHPPGEKDIREIHAALRRYGDNTLLCITPSDGRHGAGEVETLGDGLLVGRLDRPGFDGHRWDISFNCWLLLCQQAERLIRQAVRAA